MTVLVNSFEGGTNGTTITTGNSGGASGNAFDAVTGSPTFSSTHAAHGTLSCSVSVSSSSATVAWNASLGSQAQVWFREYFYIPSNPGGTIYLTSFTQAGVSTCASLMMLSTGQLAVWDNTSTAQITSTESVPLNQWFRVEGFVVGNASTGQLALNIYNQMDSVNPTETHQTAANLNTFGTINKVNFGAPVSTTFSYYLDDIGVSTAGYLGPSNTAIVYPQEAPVQAKGNGLPPRGRVGSNPGSLPALTLTNNFDGGTNTTTISTGNSGGVSGNAFSFVSIGASDTITYSNTTYASGSLSANLTNGATSNVSFVGWGPVLISQQPILYFRVCIFVSTLPVSTITALKFLCAGGAKQNGTVTINTNGTVSLHSNNATLTTSASTIPLNTWFRLEGWIAGSVNAGQASVSIFATPESQIPIETNVSVANANTYAPIQEVLFGYLTNVSSTTIYFDSLGISNQGYLGPVSFAEPNPQVTPVQAKIPLPPRGRSSGTVPKIIQLTNNFNNGTSGATVTAGNSASSGNAFDSVVIPGGATLTYSNNYSAHGSISCAVATTTDTASFYGQWATSEGTQTTIWFRVYCYLPSSSSGNWRPFSSYSSNTHAASFYFQSGVLHTSYGSGFNNGPVFTTPIPYNTWIRVEGSITGDSSHGSLSISLFTLTDSVVPTETQSANGLNTTGPITQYRFGQIAASTNSGPFYFDDIGISNAGYLGPAGLPSGAVFTPQPYPIQAKGNGLPPRGRIGSNPGSLPALLFLNSFSGGANGTTISTVNSGGVSGNAFNFVNIGSGATAVFSNSEYITDSLSAEFATGVSSAVSLIQWGAESVIGIQPAIWFRIYAYFTVNPAVGSRIATFRTSASIGSSVTVNTTGTISMANSTGAPIFTTSSVIPLNQWFRLEGFVVGSPNAGQVSLSFFSSPNAQVPAEVRTSSAAQNTGGSFSTVQFGITNATANVGAFWLDSLGISNTGYIGPASYTAQPSSGFPGTAIQSRIPQNGPAGRVYSNPGAPVPVLLTNSFEGGSNGVTITTGNSGGASGSVFSIANVGSGTTLQFSNSEYAHGSLAGEFASSSTSASAYIGWSHLLQQQLWYRAYVYFTANPSATVSLVYLLGNNNNAAAARVLINANGTISVVNSGGGNIFTTTSTIPLNQWFRIEGYFTGSPNAGQAELKLFYQQDDAQTPTEVHTSVPSQSTLGTINSVRFGLAISASNIGPFWLDDLGLSNTGYLGPSSRTAAPSLGYPVQARLPQLPVLRGRVESNPGAPVVYLTNSFEGGSNGTTISAGNSGGASGNAFNGVALGPSITYSNAEYAHGSLSMELSAGGSLTAGNVQWNLNSQISRYYFRAYLFFTANPSSNFNVINFFWGSSGGNSCGFIQVNTTGTLTFETVASGNVFTTTTTVPLNQWFRIEGFILGSQAQGQVSLSLFSPLDAQIPVETHTSAANQRTVAAPYRVDFGSTSNISNFTFWLDNLGISSTGYLGPVSFPGQASSGMPGTTIQPRPQPVPRGRVIQGQVLESSFTPPSPAPVYPQNSPVRAHAVLPQRGRCFSSPIVQQAAPHVGPPVYPQRTAVRCKLTAVPKGRVYSDFGGTVANPVIRSIRVKTGSLYQNWDSGGIYTNWTAGAPTT
jgi:hypothetical protein